MAYHMQGLIAPPIIINMICLCRRYEQLGTQSTIIQHLVQKTAGSRALMLTSQVVDGLVSLLETLWSWGLSELAKQW